MFQTLKEQFRYLRQHYFVRNVALLQMGGFAGTLIQAGAGVILARLLQPELFGVYTLAFGLAGLASVFLGSGAQEAIGTVAGETYARRDREGTTDAFVFLMKLAIFSGILTLLLATLLPLVADTVYGNGFIGRYAAIIIGGSVVSTLVFAPTALGLQVVGRIGFLTLLGLADQSVRFGLSVLFTFLGFGIAGAVSGHLVGAAAVLVIAAFLWKQAVQGGVIPSLSEILKRLWHVKLRRYFSFSIWIAVDRNVANLFAILPVLITGVFVAISEVAFFKLAFGYMNIALSLLGPVSTLLNVEFPKIRVMNQHRLRRNFIKVSLYALGLSVVLTAGALAVSPFVFRILYGQAYLPSIPYVFGLTLYGALFGIGVGLGPMWRALNELKTSIIINLLTLAIGVPLGIWFMQLWHVWGAVAMITFWYTISHLTSFLYLVRRLRKIEESSQDV